MGSSKSPPLIIFWKHLVVLTPRFCALTPASQLISEVILKMLDLMSHVKQLVRDMETSFYRTLQVWEPSSVFLFMDSQQYMYNMGVLEDQVKMRMVKYLSLQTSWILS